jgi:carbon starvation protein
MLVVAVFGHFVAEAFVNNPSVATASLLFILMAPVFGFLVHKKRIRVLHASLVFVPLLFGAVWVGMQLPLDVQVALGLENAAQAKLIWLAVLAVYAFVASVLPVWVLLQPRDYLNSYLLYSMMILGVLGIVVAGPVLQAPRFEGWVVMHKGVPSQLFPVLFVLVACGACSGFHALVASGTTSKQIDTEQHILPVGYGSMLVEGMLAIMAVVSVAYLAGGDMAATIKSEKPVGAFAAGMAHFCTHLGIEAKLGTSFFTLAISAFLLTTLDTATRLGRFAWQELFLPRHGDDKEVAGLHGAVSNRFVATLLVLVGAGFLVLMKSEAPDGTPIPGWLTIWPVFGASNQLLAALTLMVVTVILQKKKKNFLVTLLPMAFMMVICLWALCGLFMSNARGGRVNWALMTATVFLVVMAVVLIVQAGSTFVRTVRREKQG